MKKTDWSFLENSKIQKIFASPPRIGSVKIFKMKIDEQDSTIRIFFDIPDIPDVFSESSKSENRCQIGLELKHAKIEELSVKSENNKYTLEVEQGQKEFTLSFTNSRSTICIKAENIKLIHASTYIDVNQY